jgi:hypothetical protein
MVEFTLSLPYEKPAPMGWSMYSMLACSLKLCGFKIGVVAEAFGKRHGPFSFTYQSSRTRSIERELDSYLE